MPGMRAARALVFSALAVAVILGLIICGPKLLAGRPPAPTAFNTSNLVRLHVVANSDSKEDQAVKLDVRDAILAKAEELLSSADTKDEAWRILLERKDEIEAVAAEALRKAGVRYGASVEMGTFDFPERQYGHVTLPAGVYQAVRIVLGSGDGMNWWCVLFPPLCFVRATDGQGIDELRSRFSPVESLTRLRLELTAPWSPFSLAYLERSARTSTRPPAPALTLLPAPLLRPLRSSRPLETAPGAPGRLSLDGLSPRVAADDDVA